MDGKVWKAEPTTGIKQLQPRSHHIIGLVAELNEAVITDLHRLDTGLDYRLL